MILVSGQICWAQCLRLHNSAPRLPSQMDVQPTQGLILCTRRANQLGQVRHKTALAVTCSRLLVLRIHTPTMKDII